MSSTSVCCLTWNETRTVRGEPVVIFLHHNNKPGRDEHTFWSRCAYEVSEMLKQQRAFWAKPVLCRDKIRFEAYENSKTAVSLTILSTCCLIKTSTVHPNIPSMQRLSARALSGLHVSEWWYKDCILQVLSNSWKKGSPLYEQLFHLVWRRITKTTITFKVVEK